MTMIFIIFNNNIMCNTIINENMTNMKSNDQYLLIGVMKKKHLFPAYIYMYIYMDIICKHNNNNMRIM